MNDKFAETMTLDTTFLFQFKLSDGSWSWYSQTEYRAEQGAREDAEMVFSGRTEYRIIKIQRSIVEN